MLRFRAQLVMEFAEGSRTKLKRSKKHGELILSAEDGAAIEVRDRQEIIANVLKQRQARLHVSIKERESCRLVSEEDAAKCTETLRSFGVEIIGVGEAMVSAVQSSERIDMKGEIVVAGETALRAIQESSPKSMQAEIRNYESSYQLKDDKDAIVRAMFSMDR